jgi:hypothetical protein
MRILLDQHVPLPALEIIRRVVAGHQVDHVERLPKWSGKTDVFVYADARTRGYEAVVSNDRSQLADPDECDAIKRSGVHRIGYSQRQKSLRGMGAAVASILAALPDIVVELETETGQRLVTIVAVSLSHKRYEIVDPKVQPPRYWHR